MGEGAYRPPQLGDLTTVLTNLEIYFPDTPPHAKFQWAMLTWVVWENSQFDAWVFSCFPFFVTPTGRIFRHIPTHNTSLYVWGLERRKLKFDPCYPRQKTLKLWLRWRSVENFSRRNSGTVSRIELKLGTRVDHPSGITWHDAKVIWSKSHGYILFTAKMYHNLAGGCPTWYSGAVMRTTPQLVGHKMVAMATPVA